MSKVWTRNRAGTAPPLLGMLRSPLPERPEIHQVTLPLPPSWGAHDRIQVYIVESDPLTLVDTGVRTPESRAALELAFEEVGLELRDVRRVIVTHAHRDHMGLVQSLRETGADFECIAHRADALAIEQYIDVHRARCADMGDLYREYGVPDEMLGLLVGAAEQRLANQDAEGEGSTVERRVDEGDSIDFKDFSLKVLHLPGHSPGHLGLLDEATDLLWSGDAVMGQAIPNAATFYEGKLPEPGDHLGRRPRFQGLYSLRSSLRRLRSLPLRHILPGYGGVLHRPTRAIADTLLFYDVRIQRIDRGLKHLAAMGQEVTAFDLWQSMYPRDEPIEQIATHLLTMIGALDCLEADGHLVAERRADGVLTHHHG